MCLSPQLRISQAAYPGPKCPCPYLDPRIMQSLPDRTIFVCSIFQRPLYCRPLPSTSPALCFAPEGRRSRSKPRVEGTHSKWHIACLSTRDCTRLEHNCTLYCDSSLIDENCDETHNIEAEANGVLQKRLLQLWRPEW